MFTGLVEEMGTVIKREEKRGTVVFSVRARTVVRGLSTGESIAMEGVCLTTLKRNGRIFTVQAVEETLKKTTLRTVTPGRPVNLERPLTAKGRLGGHFVLGHVDCTGTVTKIAKQRGSWLFHIGIPARMMKYVIPVGSIAVNGVSLTVARLSKSSFSVSIIPHTWRVTSFKYLKEGAKVNIEFDVLGKYVLNSRGGRRRS